MTTKTRILSIDILRGIIMVIMALDHVRDFFHESAMTADPLDVASTNGPLFFTRWITHFCAPTFLFLSGLSTYVAGQGKNAGEYSNFIIKRGLFLVAFELLIMNPIFSFNPFFNFIFLQVIWAIGMSMIVLGLLMKTSYKLIFILGLILVFGHNVLDGIALQQGSIGDTLLKIFLTGSGTIVPISATRVVLFAYTILPWTGIMMLGYSLGKWYEIGFDEQKRRKSLLALGVTAVVGFVVIRFINVYGDPRPWTHQMESIRTLFSFLNVAKYPPSLVFTLMTVGPGLIILSFTEKTKNALSEFFMTYGRTPLFYFAVHFFLVHLLETIAFFATGHNFSQAIDPQSPFLFRPTNFGFSLTTVYLIWASVVLALYYPCKWFYTWKRARKAAIWKYI